MPKAVLNCMLMLTVMLPVVLMSAGCGDDSPPPTDRNGMHNTMEHPQAWPGSTKLAPAPMAPQPSKPDHSMQPVSKGDGSAVPPKDAQFTIYCEDFNGPSHVDLANHEKSELARVSGMKGWYLVHQEDHSSLFYGYYRDANEPAAKADRAKIQSFQDQFGTRRFAGAVVVPVDAPDPVAPPDWNLANARTAETDTTHYWSIQIAAYKDSPERKQAAVETVREARKQGIEAYFFHGETVSSVCVGMWPQSAVREEGVKEGEVRAEDSDPDSALIVTPGMKIPENQLRAARRQGDNVVQPKITILDPQMVAMKQRFQNNIVNGSMLAGPSLIVHVPIAVHPSLMAGNNNGQPPPPSQQSDALRAIMPEPKR